MKTNLFKGLGALSLALAMPLFGGAPIDVSMKTEKKFNNITNDFYQQSYLNIQSNVDSIVIQNIELNRGNCKDEVYDAVMQKLGYKDKYAILKNIENERDEILEQLKGIKEEKNMEGVTTSMGMQNATADIRYAIANLEYTIKNNEKLQKELNTINTYEELRKRLDNPNFHYFPRLDKNGFAPSTNEEPPKSKELYSLMAFHESLFEILKVVFSPNNDNFNGKVENLDKLSSRGCNSYAYGGFSIVSTKCISRNSYHRKYYLNDYVKGIVGDANYNDFMDEDFWKETLENYWGKKMSQEQLGKLRQDLANAEQKIYTAYLKKYKEVVLTQSNATLKIAQAKLLEFRKEHQREQQEYKQKHQQQRQENIKEEKQLTQKLAQLNQKIKNMKEQGNTIRVPLKFGQVFKTRACSNLKEAKIKTNKGTWTFSF
ncbi:hypothetical protein [Helicobacter cetorum]|uniref:Periplasmic protein n=1 Tax=Helicobacter cetorum (strain ATCC BAA-429 / MIT 00-7128) TaxID=182217 RepID=I0EKK2_HELC0|nr:hypothetical protein [Helicobacter cetorum]AFI03471.1 hypothetical protein HCW_00890 [Helicobacter cetorum MIT 00-7128]